MSEFDDDFELEEEFSAQEEKAARALARALEGGDVAETEAFATDGTLAPDSEPLPHELAALLRSVDSLELRPEALSHGRTEMLGALEQQMTKHGSLLGSSAGVAGCAPSRATPNPLRWLAWLPLPLAAAAGIFFVLRQPTQDTAAEMTSAVAVRSPQVTQPVATGPSSHLLTLQAQALTARLAQTTPDDEREADSAIGAQEPVVRPDDYEREMRAYRGQLLAVVDRRGQ